MTDDEIVKTLGRVADRDPQAEVALWAALKPLAGSVARRHLSTIGNTEADDAVGEILQKVFANAASYTLDKAGPRTWVQRIAENHCKDILDKRRRRGMDMVADEGALMTMRSEQPGPYTYVIGADAEDRWKAGAIDWVGKSITVDSKVLTFMPAHEQCMRVMVVRDNDSIPALNFNVAALAVLLDKPRGTVQHLLQRIVLFLENSEDAPRVMEGFRDLWAHRPEIRTAIFKPVEDGT